MRQINKGKSKPVMPSTFKIDGNSITYPVNIFLAIGSTLAKKIPPGAGCTKGVSVAIHHLNRYPPDKI
jgi:hypothetical protein